MPGEERGNARIVHTDCRFYRGSAPCAPHKATGVLCAECEQYQPIGERILVVKLGAMGDVLRTTALLPDICAAHDRAAITWIVRAESLEIVKRHPLVHRAITTDAAPAILATRRFDAVYALDCDEEGLAFARLAVAPLRRGYRAGRDGTAVGVEPGGDDTIFKLGIFDDLKRANRRSYLELLLAAAGLSYSGARPTIVTDPLVAARVASELAALPRPLIGLSPHAAPRWAHKRWTEQHAATLALMLIDRGFGTLLFGEGADYEWNAALAAHLGPAAHAFRSDRDLGRLFAGITNVDALVTVDSIAMHGAWALGIPVVALFGPTSSHEIDLGPADRKLVPDLPCLSCYLPDCSIDPHCMQLLTPDRVLGALLERLAVPVEV